MNLRRLLFIVHCSLFIAMPSALLAASDFQTAAQLLSAAKNADIGQVQALVNNGADVNFVDNTGLSIVCTALMNKDVRAAQILQMYGADASRCDQQIKKYNNKQPKTESGGLFGGLSTAQSLALTAAGAAVVVGGVMLLGGGFGSGGGGAGASSGDRPNNNGNNNSGNGTATGTAALPYGPAMPNATSENTNYIANLNVYSPGTPGILADNFYLMNNTGAQNYLLIMHGYSPLARGYSGMRTLRNTATYAPLSLSNINLGPDAVQGGRPVNVALITANGVNAISDSSLGDKLTPWTTCNGTNCATVSAASNDMISSKYYNNKINRGTDNGSLSDDTTAEDSALLSMLDLSGSGTAINSTAATNDDNILAKIVGGNLSGYTNADYVGFMPNGQMTIFRTGGGTGFKAVPGGATAAFDSGTDTIGGVAVSYIGADGFYYVDTNADGAVDTAYLVAGAVATVAKQLGDIDYYNYKALYNAGILWAAGDGVSGGRSRPDIVANASVVSGLHLRDAKTLSWITSSANKTTDFFSWINEYYDRDTTDGAVAGTDAFPATDAYNFFMGLGTNFSPLVIFSTGAFETDSAWSGPTLEAGFENAAPLVFSNAEHLFASVVAVHINGTGTTCTGSGCSVSGYSPGGKIALSQWGTDTNGDSIADTFYKARSCGIAGRGAGGIDPWCFAAAGMTDEMAVASFAGAAGAVKGAFSYMDSKQIFALLALTADGAYLGSNGTGLPGSTPIAWTAGGLASYLQSMYELPAEAQFRVDGGEDYLTVFKEVFGYGLVNLERATKPGSKIYYYNGSDIVSGSGDAYWRAASTTAFSPSAAIGIRSGSISASYYDVLESAEGELYMPRVFENEFALNAGGRRGLYLGDVLGEFETQKAEGIGQKAGGVSFDMKFSESNRTGDNLNGLQNMSFGFATGDYSVGAKFQRHLSDFDDKVALVRGDRDNPILSLASNAISSSAALKSGNWSFGGRAFSGAITDETLLENDPSLTAQYMPANLGQASGAESRVGWSNEKLSFGVNIGTMKETATVLGAYTDGLLALGGGDTIYLDNVVGFAATPDVRFMARATFAKTRANPGGEFVLGLSELESDAFSAGAEIGNFSFTAAMPLAVSKGVMQYAGADYSVMENEDGNYDLVADTYAGNLNLAPEKRETRFSAMYRFGIDENTNAAVGVIYRLHPNHTDDFGSEGILMMKLKHSW